jgi:GT2 family glycosyltransferase
MLKKLKPGVTVIIPVYDCPDLTKNCLESIFRVPESTPFDILVIDNGSQPETQNILASFGEDIRVIRNEKNLGFARACNQGAFYAEREYLHFLNNDTLVLPGWLDELYNYMRSNKQCGIAGSKLLYPDGSLQHGGVVFGSNRIPFHLYAGLFGEDPIINQIREFQAVTGASLMITKELFLFVDCFNDAFVNGFEDIDLCLKVRLCEKKIMYLPDSTIIHFESKSKERTDAFAHNLALFKKNWLEIAKPDGIWHSNHPNLTVYYDGFYKFMLKKEFKKEFERIMQEWQSVIQFSQPKQQIQSIYEFCIRYPHCREFQVILKKLADQHPQYLQLHHKQDIELRNQMFSLYPNLGSTL